MFLAEERGVREDVHGHVEHGDGARGDLLVAANLAGHQHGGPGEGLVHHLPERVHVLDVANRRDGEMICHAPISASARSSRSVAREPARARTRPAADHLLGEEVHRPVLDAARDANLGRAWLHLGSGVIACRAAMRQAQSTTALARRALRVTAAARSSTLRHSMSARTCPLDVGRESARFSV